MSACRPQRPLSVLVLLLAAILPTTFGDNSALSQPPAEETAKARAIAHRMLDAMGGQKAYDAARYVSFDFFGRRSHVWDKHAGRHRLEGETQDGERYLVIHDVADQGSAEGTGRVWLDGEELTGDPRAEWLERAYGAWINDTYWLVMPYKLLDPGVHLAYEGPETVDGTTYDVVRLSFDGVGLTPGDRYWAYVNRKTSRMERWSYHLESMEPDAEPTVWAWAGWQPYEGVWLADTRKRLTGDPVEVSMGPIEVMTDVDGGLFEGP